ncbi:hypothetical protein diail_9098, partial [Diaporthe ilicicola]
MPSGSSSKGKQRPKKNWGWTQARDFDLSAHFKNIDKLRESFDHKDFRLSRAWICFAEEHHNANLMVNHVSLKFDFKRCDNHPWRGVKLEVKILDLEGETFEDPSSEEEITAAAVVLALKEWEGPPNGMRFCVEIETAFEVVHGGTTLGDFIRILSGSRLLRFGFGTKTSCHGDEVFVGCRDYIWDLQVREEDTELRQENTEPSQEDTEVRGDLQVRQEDTEVKGDLQVREEDTELRQEDTEPSQEDTELRGDLQVREEDTELRQEDTEPSQEDTELRGDLQVRQEDTEVRQEVTEVRQEVTEVRQEVTEVRQEVTEVRQAETE